MENTKKINFAKFKLPALIGGGLIAVVYLFIMKPVINSTSELSLVKRKW